MALLARRSKYGVDTSELGKIRRTYKGQLYASRAELQYAMRLDLLQRAGKIECWYRPEPLDLVVNLQVVGRYRPDFAVKNGRLEYHEIKGHRGPLGLLKFKIAQACLPLVRFRWFQAQATKAGYEFTEAKV
jgi:hypothetical protein